MEISSPLHHEHMAASLHSLRRFIRQRAADTSALPELEHCEMCSEPLTPEHRHLLELSRRTALCACDACALLFSSSGASEGKYRLIPRRKLALLNFQMTDEQWDALALPVNIVYLFNSSVAGRAMAFYPSPAGAMESLLDLENWDTLVRDNPILSTLEPDVEALLINRVEQTRAYYVVPIDVCYRLVGLLRISWHGLSGGQESRDALKTFFAELDAQALTDDGGFHA